MRQEYKEQTEQFGIAKTERPLPAGRVPRMRLLMELLMPCELSQTMEVPVPTGLGGVTMRDPSDTLGDPVVGKTKRQLVEAAGQLMAIRIALGSVVTAPYGTIYDTGRVELFSELLRRIGAATMTKRKIREMRIKKLSRGLDIQKINQIKHSFPGSWRQTDRQTCKLVSLDQLGDQR